MKTHFDCFACFLTQTKRTAILLELPHDTIWQLLKICAAGLAKMDVELPPPQNAVAIYDAISKGTGLLDPFKELKEKSTEQALAIYPLLKQRIRDHHDSLEAAIRYAACGNVIDYGISSEFDIMAEVDKALHADFFHWEYSLFKSRLKEAQWVLYLGDNCGETVFDRLLIQELGVPVTYAVRGGPIINDVTLEDARLAGLDQVATVVSTGCRAPGIVFDWCSQEFLDLYERAPLIISKGQGNFETLSHERREIFFLFKIKCNVVSEFLRCPLNTMFFGRTLDLIG